MFSYLLSYDIVLAVHSGDGDGRSRLELALAALAIFDCVVLGPAAPPALAALGAQGWLLLELSATLRPERQRGVPSLGELSLLSAIWLFLGRLSFFVTAHAHSFERLHVTASFVGFTGDSVESELGRLRSAVLVFYNTFGTQIMMLISLPLLLLHGGKQLSWPSPAVSSAAKVSTRLLILLYLLWLVIAALCAAICAAVHRRHLMVWAIFAPKFCFEAVSRNIIGRNSCCVNVCVRTFWLAL